MNLRGALADTGGAILRGAGNAVRAYPQAADAVLRRRAQRDILSDRQNLRQEREDAKRKQEDLSRRMAEYVTALQEAEQTKDTSKLDMVFRSTLEGLPPSTQLDFQKLHQAAVQQINQPAPQVDPYGGMTPYQQGQLYGQGTLVEPGEGGRPTFSRDPNWRGRGDTYNEDDPFDTPKEISDWMNIFNSLYFDKEGNPKPGVTKIPNFWDWAQRVRTRVKRGEQPGDAARGAADDMQGRNPAHFSGAPQQEAYQIPGEGGPSAGPYRDARGDVHDRTSLQGAGKPTSRAAPTLQGAQGGEILDGKALSEAYQQAIQEGKAQQFLANLTDAEKQALNDYQYP